MIKTVSKLTFEAENERWRLIKTNIVDDSLQDISYFDRLEDAVFACPKALMSLDPITVAALCREFLANMN